MSSSRFEFDDVVDNLCGEDEGAGDDGGDEASVREGFGIVPKSSICLGVRKSLGVMSAKPKY